MSYVTLKIYSCRECPHAKEGMGYSLDGFDHGNDWTCTKANKQIAGFVERSSEKLEIPKWCPLWAPLLKKKGTEP